MIEASRHITLTIEIKDEDIDIFARLVQKIKERPAGFLREALSEEEETLLQCLYGMFTFEDNG